MTEETQITESTNHKRAVEFVGNNSMSNIIDHLETQYDRVEQSLENNRVLRGRLQKFVDVTTEFLKDGLKDGVNRDDLLSLANELEIELTKDITVTFTVTYTGEFTVPFDFDADTITEEDFRVNVEIEDSSIEGDITVDSESTEVSDYEVEEN